MAAVLRDKPTGASPDIMPGINYCETNYISATATAAPERSQRKVEAATAKKTTKIKVAAASYLG